MVVGRRRTGRGGPGKQFGLVLLEKAQWGGGGGVLLAVPCLERDEGSVSY